MDDIPLPRPLTLEDLEEFRKRCISEAKQRRGEFAPLSSSNVPLPALNLWRRLCKEICGCQVKPAEADSFPQINRIIFSEEEINGYYRKALAELRGDIPWTSRPLTFSLKTPKTPAT